MPELKKIDYRELGKEAAEEPLQQAPQEAAPAAPVEQAQQPAALAGPVRGSASNGASQEKIPFFASLANKWSLTDKKIKIEVVMLIAVLAAILVVVVYYFTQKPPRYIPEEFYSPPAVENWQGEQ